jgi:cold shock CspA family protein
VRVENWLDWQSGVVTHIDKDQKFAFIKSQGGDVYVHSSTPGFPTLLERGKQTPVSFVARPGKQGPEATKVRVEHQQIPVPKAHWCSHPDCHESIDCFDTESALEQHMRDAHGNSVELDSRSFEEKMRRLLMEHAQEPLHASKISQLYELTYQEEYKAVAPSKKQRTTLASLPFCRIIDRLPTNDPTQAPVMYVQYEDDRGEDASLGRMTSSRRREVAAELTEQMMNELHEEIDPLYIEEDLDRVASGLDEDSRKALVLQGLKEDVFEKDCETFEEEIDAGEHHLLDEQRLLLEMNLQNERLREELALDKEAELVKHALQLGQEDKELPVGTRLSYEGRGHGTIVGFNKRFVGPNEHLVDFDCAPSGSDPEAVRLKFSAFDKPKAWSIIASGTSSPLAALEGTSVAQPTWAAPTPREQVVRIWLAHGREDKLCQLDELAAKAGSDERLLDNVRRKYLTSTTSASDYTAALDDGIQDDEDL